MATDFADWTQGVTVSAPNNFLARTSAGNGGTGSLSQIAIPAGAVAIGYMFEEDSSKVAPAQVTVTGHQTAHKYLDDANPPNGVQWALFNNWDFQADMSITAPAVGLCEVDLLYWVIPPGLERGVDTPFQSKVVLATLSGTPTHILAGVTMKTIRVFNWSCYVNQVSFPTGSVTLQDTVGPNVIDELAIIGSAVQGQPPPLGGIPLPGGPGAGLDVVSGASFAAIIRVGYSLR